MNKLSIFICAIFLIFLSAAFIEKGDTHDFAVISVHEIELKPGVNENEFEKFVLSEIAPIYDKMKGQHLTLVKGDRGIRTDKYAIILSFESIDDRNRIYPPSGELVGDFGKDSMWEKFKSMVDVGLGEHHTDYGKIMN